MKHLKPIIPIFILFFVFSINANAQEEKSVRKQIETEKIAFFTEKIGLSLEEAKKFWPVYDEYWEKKRELINKRKERMNYYLKHSGNMSKTELENLADEYVDYRYKKAKLLKEYHKKFKEILPIEKVMRIYMADYDFKSYLLKKLKKSGDNNGN